MKAGITLTALLCAAGAGQAQVVVRAGSVKAEAGPASNFTGTASVRALTTARAPGRTSVGLVSFRAGARTHWHTHPGGQTLHVTEGCGWTQVEGGPVTRMCKGDTVYAAPGVRHWHGATATEAMSHLHITETIGGSPVEWMEPVTDAQYHL